MDTRYFLTRGDGHEQEVTKREWVDAERRAGFYNTRGENDEPATAAFSAHSYIGEEVSGRIEYSR